MDLEKRATCPSQEQDRSAHQEGGQDGFDDYDVHGFLDHIDGHEHEDGDDVEHAGGQLQQLHWEGRQHWLTISQGRDLVLLSPILIMVTILSLSQQDMMDLNTELTGYFSR